MEAQNTVLMLMILTMFSRSNGKIFLNESEGNFSSSFDESGKNVNQDWVIQVPSGRIELTFDSFTFFKSDANCDFGYVEVYDVEKKNETFLRFRLCGQQPPHKIISSSNTLFIEFRVANTTYQTVQFTANYTTIRDNDIEYEILRDEETWEGAFSKCRENNGYLVKTSSKEDKNRLRQYIRANEEVWVGTYTTPWLWTRDCVEYEYQQDKFFYIPENHAAQCQQKCGTDNVLLQQNVCLCKHSDTGIKWVSDERCNMLCKGDKNDVCGGDGVFMRYQKWVTSDANLTGISNHDKNCIAYLKFDGTHLWKWNTVKCDSKRQTMCIKKSNQMSSAYNILPALMQYTNAVNACLSEQKMIPDIQYDKIIPSKDRKKIPDQLKGIWVGLRRKRVSVSKHTVNVKVEKAYNACYYLVLTSKQILSTHIGNCSQARPYYCKKLNFIRSSEKSPTQTITGFKPSTMTTDRDHTHTDASSMDNDTFEELTTLSRSLSTSVNKTPSDFVSSPFFTVLLICLAIVLCGSVVLCVVVYYRCYRYTRLLPRDSNDRPYAALNLQPRQPGHYDEIDETEMVGISSDVTAGAHAINLEEPSTGVTLNENRNYMNTMNTSSSLEAGAIGQASNINQNLPTLYQNSVGFKTVKTTVLNQDVYTNAENNGNVNTDIRETSRIDSDDYVDMRNLDDYVNTKIP